MQSQKIVHILVPCLSFFFMIYHPLLHTGEHQTITEGKQTRIRVLHDCGRRDALFFIDSSPAVVGEHDRVALHTVIYAVSMQRHQG